MKRELIKQLIDELRHPERWSARLAWDYSKIFGRAYDPGAPSPYHQQKPCGCALAVAAGLPAFEAEGLRIMDMTFHIPLFDDNVASPSARMARLLEISPEDSLRIFFDLGEERSPETVTPLMVARALQELLDGEVRS